MAKRLKEKEAEDKKIDKRKTKEKRGKEKKKIGFIRILLFILFLVLFIFSLVNLIRWAIFNHRSQKDIEEVQSAVIVGEFEKEKAEDEADDEASNPVDFQALKEINSDAVAWIRIDGTNINYPVLQTSDNEYYLHKDINKKYSTCGWIFMDWQNNENFIDKNTVIYGHNIKSGVMFADLLKVQRGELGKDITIEIYTENQKFSYVTEPEDYAIKSNIVSEDSMNQYLKTMISRSSVNYNIMPTKTDRVLTLSTCDNSGQNRVLVHAVLIGEEVYEK